MFLPPKTFLFFQTGVSFLSFTNACNNSFRDSSSFAKKSFFVFLTFDTIKLMAEAVDDDNSLVASLNVPKNVFESSFTFWSSFLSTKSAFGCICIWGLSVEKFSSGRVGNICSFLACMPSLGFFGKNFRSGIFGLLSKGLFNEERLVTKLLQRKGSEDKGRWFAGSVLAVKFAPCSELYALIFSAEDRGFSWSLTRFNEVFVTPLSFLLLPSLYEKTRKKRRRTDVILSGITIKRRYLLYEFGIIEVILWLG